MALLHRLPRAVRSVGKPVAYYARRPWAIFTQRRVVVTSDGISMHCHPENLIERSILATGEWEPWETAIVRRVIKPGAVALDLGANVGYFTLLMARQAGKTGVIHAFEPTNYAHRRLTDNIDLNPQLKKSIKVVKQGLLAAAETRMAALEARFSDRVLAHSEPQAITFTTVDNYVMEQAVPHVDFLKIDIDGHDFEAIRGAEQTIRNHRPLILAEVCERVLLENQTSVSEYINLLCELGYDSAMAAWSDCPKPTHELAQDSRLARSPNLLLVPDNSYLQIPASCTQITS